MRSIVILLSILILTLVACTPQEPVLIIITPTPQTPTTVPTEAMMLAPAESTTPAPTAGVITEFVDITITPSSAVPTDSGTPYGAIIGQGYVLPPTTTPRATRTPMTTPTPEPDEPSATPEPPASPTAITTPITIGALDGERIGIQAYYNVDIDTWFNVVTQAQKMNMGWIKLQANWAFLQPNGPDDYDQNFRLFEAHVQRARNMGFRVMISVAKAPLWARGTDQSEDGPPDDPQLLANFLSFMIERIKAENIAALEIWNEPNLIREWRGALPFDGAGYMQLFRPAYDAVRASGPNIQIVTAGLAPTGTTDGSIDDRLFLQQMYDAGLAQYADVAIGAHPYGWGNPPDAICCDLSDARGWDDDPRFFFADTLTVYRDIMVRNDHASSSIWVTEFGWATWEGYPTEPPEPWMTYNTAQDQLNYTLRAFEIGLNTDYIGVMILWNLNFGDEDLIEAREEIAGYALMYSLPGEGLFRRPLFGALETAIRRGQ